MEEYSTKRCTKCGVNYPLVDEYWYKDSKVKSGYTSWCRECMKQRSREYGAEHKEQKAANGLRWQRENREKCRGYNRTAYARDPEKSLIRWAKREAKKKSLPHTLTPQEWEDIKAEYGYSCAYCGKGWYELDSVLEQDHVIPVSQGGGYTKDNIVPACRSCNRSKAYKTPEQAGMTLR